MVNRNAGGARMMPGVVRSLADTRHGWQVRTDNRHRISAGSACSARPRLRPLRPPRQSHPTPRLDAGRARHQFVDRVLPVDAEVAHAWGRLAAAGKRDGRELPVIDGLLLATASVHGLTLVTRNARDCAGRGVPAHDPWEDVPE